MTRREDSGRKRISKEKRREDSDKFIQRAIECLKGETDLPISEEEIAAFTERFLKDSTVDDVKRMMGGISAFNYICFAIGAVFEEPPEFVAQALTLIVISQMEVMREEIANEIARNN